MNPTAGEYFLHILHGQFPGIHFLISPLKEEDKDDFVSFLRVQWSNGLVLRCWTPIQGSHVQKPLGGFKVDSAVHPSEADQMSTSNFWELSGKK